MLTELDLKQLEEKGINPSEIKTQIESFTKGFPFLQIVKPATIGDGIIRLDPEEVDNLIDLYRTFEGSRLKFVPASGAATRMFKHLFEFRDEFPSKGMECFSDKTFNSIHYFFQNIQKFPFYDKLYNELWSIGYKMEELLANNDYLPIIDSLLNSDGLNYVFLPKGLIYFHKYGDIARTALEEHIVEGSKYARDIHGNVYMHLTVSPEHRQGFLELIDRVKSFYENHYEVTLHITFSEQKPCTDTIAVDMQNNPFRNSDGTIAFRPGGHGALIENLNDLESDIIFIKNIDNVAPDHLKHQTIRFKKALAGLLISYRNLIYDYIRRLNDESLGLNEELINEVMEFTRDELCIIPPAALNGNDLPSVVKYLVSVLNRPIRVCGMVKNQGEPGGGPFWAINPNGTSSLQIVESSQIDLNNPRMKEIFGQSTHFNPVDLVCCTKDYQGQRFNLHQFRDSETGFISVKSKDGKQLKALELPGLWNGAMSNWNTIFVEVPLATFSPVKTVNDLLRSEHQGGGC